MSKQGAMRMKMQQTKKKMAPRRNLSAQAQKASGAANHLTHGQHQQHHHHHHEQKQRHHKKKKELERSASKADPNDVETWVLGAEERNAPGVSMCLKVKGRGLLMGVTDALIEAGAMATLFEPHPGLHQADAAGLHQEFVHDGAGRLRPQHCPSLALDLRGGQTMHGQLHGTRLEFWPAAAAPAGTVLAVAKAKPLLPEVPPVLHKGEGEGPQEAAAKAAASSDNADVGAISSQRFHLDADGHLCSYADGGCLVVGAAKDRDEVREGAPLFLIHVSSPDALRFEWALPPRRRRLLRLSSARTVLPTIPSGSDASLLLEAGTGSTDTPPVELSEVYGSKDEMSASAGSLITKGVRRGSQLMVAYMSGGGARGGSFDRSKSNDLERQLGHSQSDTFDDQHEFRPATRQYRPPKAASPAEQAAVRSEIEAWRVYLARPKGVLDPNTWYMVVWRGLSMASLAFTATVTPYEVALLESRPGSALWVLNRTVEVFWALDILVQFNLSYEDVEKERIVTDLARIRRKYVRTWLALDLLSVVPFEVIGLHALRWVRTIRLFRLLKMLRMVKVSVALRKVEQRCLLSHAHTTLIKFGFWVLLMSHWMACGWCMVALQLQRGGESTWLTALQEGMDEEKGMDRAVNVYVAGVYWAVVTITSVGYGDISATNPVEHRAAVAAVLLSSCMWAYIIGSACGIVSNLDLAAIAHHQTMDQLNLFLRENKKDFAPPMRDKMRDFFHHTASMARTEDYHHSLISKLSPVLQREVMAKYSGWIKHVPYLSKARSPFIVGLVGAASWSLFIPQERIRTCDELKIVMRGMGSFQAKVLSQGSVWGSDFVLGFDVQRLELRRLRDTSWATALTYLEVMMVSSANLGYMLQGFPAEEATIRKYAERRAAQTNILRVAAFIKRSGGVEAAFARFYGSSNTAPFFDAHATLSPVSAETGQGGFSDVRSNSDAASGGMKGRRRITAATATSPVSNSEQEADSEDEEGGLATPSAQHTHEMLAAPRFSAESYTSSKAMGREHSNVSFGGGGGGGGGSEEEADRSSSSSSSSDDESDSDGGEGEGGGLDGSERREGGIKSWEERERREAGEHEGGLPRPSSFVSPGGVVSPGGTYSGGGASSVAPLPEPSALRHAQNPAAAANRNQGGAIATLRLGRNQRALRAQRRAKAAAKAPWALSLPPPPPPPPPQRPSSAQLSGGGGARFVSVEVGEEGKEDWEEEESEEEESEEEQGGGVDGAAAAESLRGMERRLQGLESLLSRLVCHLGMPPPPPPPPPAVPPRDDLPPKQGEEGEKTAEEEDEKEQAGEEEEERHAIEAAGVATKAEEEEEGEGERHPVEAIGAAAKAEEVGALSEAPEGAAAATREALPSDEEAKAKEVGKDAPAEAAGAEVEVAKLRTGD